jgi:dihydrofolate reductase
MKYALIVAIGKNNEIGKNNDLLWHLPRDMKFFKETTAGQIVVMGRKNWESIPEKFRPLPNRENIILTRNADYKAEGATVITSYDEIPHAVQNHKKTCFIIGGAQVYDLALQEDYLNEMYITYVDESFGADTYFPKIELENWNEEVLLRYEKDERNPYSFTVKRYWR